MADTFNYRIDHHGSLVRPAELLTAREKAAVGELDPDTLRVAEADAIAEAVTYQRKLRSTVVTDGDFRYSDFRDSVLRNVAGFRRTGAPATGLTRWVAESLPKANGPLVADDASRLAELTLIAPKVSLPSPGYLAATTFDPDLTTGPASAREFGDALAEIIGAEIALLVERGVRLIQLDNPLLLGHLGTEHATAGALPFDEILAVESAAVEHGELPEGTRVGFCPGWSAPSEVDRSRATRMYGTITADRWILPFDKGTAAELDLVRALPEDRDACLGVLDPAAAELEEIDDVMARIDAAAEVKDIEDMAVSPSRGFADVATRPLCDAEHQRRTLVQVETVARYCWGNEF